MFKLELTTAVATCLLAGIVTDTLGFQPRNENCGEFEPLGPMKGK